MGEEITNVSLTESIYKIMAVKESLYRMLDPQAPQLPAIEQTASLALLDSLAADLEQIQQDIHNAR